MTLKGIPVNHGTTIVSKISKSSKQIVEELRKKSIDAVLCKRRSDAFCSQK
ncbi:hypothetical protein JCM9140_2853 [Halalkalibacter wakoensis JCM 9140]|uniref:Uncharacterized protein n=1 Tax=Halalkalibacter wakoensis JCM 9140 TaxID=1236970 RepID=W4Q478_9BACI|nr:hypothetical protein [Halalkalibacter wakoensis]GAE26760.1 hypothetical protein JCM9140_2853 [Halalkalibacter wakoensis JCM 9140]